MNDSIYDAINQEFVDDVERFLATDTNFIEDGFWTPLHAASRVGNMAIVESILRYINNTPDSCFDINTEFEIIDQYSDKRGTALTEALLRNHKDAAKLLIKNGANVNATYFSQDSDTPEWSFGSYELATDQGVAWWLADEEIFSLCIKYGLDINAKGDNGKTALVCAIAASRPENVLRFLSFGANLEQYIDHEYMGRISLLIDAVEIHCNRHTEESFRVVEALLQNGATLSSVCQDCDNESVIDIVLDRCDARLIELFGLGNIAGRLGNP